MTEFPEVRYRELSTKYFLLGDVKKKAKYQLDKWVTCTYYKMHSKVEVK